MEKDAEDQEKKSGTDQARDKWDRGKQNQKVSIKCYNCGGKGHMARSSPSNSYFCSDSRTVVPEPQDWVQGVGRSGTVEGIAVNSILLDTGCSRTLVHKYLVPEDRFLEGEAVTIRCAHGDTVLYPLARVKLEIDGHQIVMEAAISENLPMDVLLGTDVPELPKLLGAGVLPAGEEPVADAMAVSTRGQMKQRETNQRIQEEKDTASGAHPSTIEELSDGGEQPLHLREDAEEPVWELGKELADDLFLLQRERTMLTRRQKRDGKAEFRRREGMQGSHTHTHTWYFCRRSEVTTAD